MVLNRKGRTQPRKFLKNWDFFKKEFLKINNSTDTDGQRLF
jgi:hypothetical protein